MPSKPSTICSGLSKNATSLGFAPLELSELISVVIRGDSMWPTLNDGDEIEFKPIGESILHIGDIVVAQHPLKPTVKVVKRIFAIIESQYVLQGDNPDPLASEDSHNFGPVNRNLVLGYLRSEQSA